MNLRWIEVGEIWFEVFVALHRALLSAIRRKGRKITVGLTLLFLSLAAPQAMADFNSDIDSPPIPIFFKKGADVQGDEAIQTQIRTRCPGGGSPGLLKMTPKAVAGPVEVESGETYKVFELEVSVPNGFCALENPEDTSFLSFNCDGEKPTWHGRLILDCLENHETHIPTVRVVDDEGEPQDPEPPTRFSVTTRFTTSSGDSEYDPSLGIRLDLLRFARSNDAISYDLALELEGSWQSFEKQYFFDGVPLEQRGDHFLLGLNLVYRAPMNDRWNLQVIGGAGWSFVTGLEASALDDSFGLMGAPIDMENVGFENGELSPTVGLGAEFLQDCWSLNFRGLWRPHGNRIDSEDVFDLQVGLGFRF